MSEVRVISHLSETIRGRYDGKDYVFKPEKATDIPVLAARHIFGMGMEDKSQAFNQLGWLVPGKDTYQSAQEKLAQISFLEGKTVFEDDEAGDEPGEEDETIDEGVPTAPRPRRRTGGRPHVSGPGGETAAGGQPSAAATPA